MGGNDSDSDSSSSGSDWNPDQVAPVALQAVTTFGTKVAVASSSTNEHQSPATQQPGVESDPAAAGGNTEHQTQCGMEAGGGHSLPGMKRIVCKGHNSGILSLSLSPDKGILCSGSKDGQLSMWDFSDLCRNLKMGDKKASSEDEGGSGLGLKPTRVLFPFPHRAEEGQFQAVTAMSWSCDGQYFVAAEDGDRPIIINRNGAMGDRCVRGQQGFLNPVKAVGHSNSVVGVDCSPTAPHRFLTVGGVDQTVRIWDSKKGVELGSVFCVVHGSGRLGGSGFDKVLCGQHLVPGSASNNPNGALFVTCGTDKLAQIWDEKQPYKPGKPMKSVQLPSPATSLSTAKCDNTNLVSFRCQDDSVYVYDLRKLHEGVYSKHPIGPLPGGTDHPEVVSFVSSGSARRPTASVALVTGLSSPFGRGGHVVVVSDIQDSNVSASPPGLNAAQLMDSCSGTSICAADDGSCIFAGGSNGGLFCFYDPTPSGIPTTGAACNFAAWITTWEEAKRAVKGGGVSHQSRNNRPAVSRYLGSDGLDAKRKKMEDDDGMGDADVFSKF